MTEATKPKQKKKPVAASDLVAAYMQGLETGKSNADIAKSLKMDEAGFNVRLSQIRIATRNRTATFSREIPGEDGNPIVQELSGKEMAAELDVAVQKLHKQDGLTLVKAGVELPKRKSTGSAAADALDAQIAVLVGGTSESAESTESDESEEKDSE